MPDVPRDFPHIFLSDHGNAERYSSPREGRPRRPPDRVTAEHAAFLERQMEEAIAEARLRAEQRNAELTSGVRGLHLEFKVTADSTEALDRLENRPRRIELLSVRAPDEQGDPYTATVFIPEQKADFFLKRIREYRDEQTQSGRPKHEGLANRLEGVRAGTARSIFTDDLAYFPEGNLATWWEVWLRDHSSGRFREAAQKLDVQLGDSEIVFPERRVLLAYTNEATLDILLTHIDSIAELRLPKDTPAFFLDLSTVEQAEWAADLAERAQLQPDSNVTICVLDSGITVNHPLIAPFLALSDTVDPNWGVADSVFWRGHGTGMAGLVLFGDLVVPLASNQAVPVHSTVESVKFLPPQGQNDPVLYAAITAEAVARAEQRAPNRNRVICIAVTSDFQSARGSPSSWSAGLDQISFGEEHYKRLILVSAGNVADPVNAYEYPDRNDIEEVQSPAQAWNPLTVGAYTDKTTIQDPQLNGWAPLASLGSLGPRSRTSLVWMKQWPIKPDVVFEGGNLATDGINLALSADDLSLLSTNFDLSVGHFRHFEGTSPATALASRMAAHLCYLYPQHWPETTRALIVHSAEWTPAMRSQLGPNPTQTQKGNLLRRYGYGVPNLPRALRSARNDFTLVVQDSLTPFRRQDSAVVTNEMNVHQFPWPTAILEELGEAQVELKVTLSYFIEPNPGERGWSRRHRYASHGLRFELKGMLEDTQSFRERINRAAQADDPSRASGPGTTEGDAWFFRQVRDTGSLHSDVWRGTAIELSQRDAIAVFPVTGWWKEKRSLDRWGRTARYSLLVSVRIPDIDVDIYTPVANALNVPVEVY
ncbi:MAG TPA: S8 family peptidase [Trueperaceae bacterium]